LSTTKFNLKLVNPKVLLITFVSSAAGGLYEAISPFFPLFLGGLGYTTIEVGLAASFWNIIIFLLHSVLLFVILYLICRRSFMENVASIIVSIIAGTAAGYWVGGLLGFTVSHSSFPTLPSLFIFSNVVCQFAACSAAYVNSKWRFLTSRKNIACERPFGVAIIAALYVVLGISLTILTCTVMGLFYIFPFEALLTKAFIFVGLVFLLVVASAIYFVVAYGFYRGNKWGWLVIFASTIIGMFLSINQLLFGFHFDVWLIAKILAPLLNIFVLIYLLQLHVRIYFGIVNPMSESVLGLSGNAES
jgi:hypothetical protein